MGTTEAQTATEQGTDPRGAWSPGRIAIAAVLLSPLPAGILHALNYVRLGRPELKRRALVANLCGAVGVGTAAWFLPWAGLFFYVAYAGYFQWSQTALFEKHLARGGRRAKVLLPALGWFVCTVGPLALLAEAIGPALVDDRFDRGLAMIDDGRLDEAETIFLDYLKSEPRNPWPRWNLAVIEHRRARLDKAADHIRILMREHPGFDNAGEYLLELEQRAQFARGVELMDQNRLDEAERIFLEYLRLGPEERDTRWNLAVIYERTGDIPKAIEELRTLLREHAGYVEAIDYLDRLEESRR